MAGHCNADCQAQDIPTRVERRIQHEPWVVLVLRAVSIVRAQRGILANVEERFFKCRVVDGVGQVLYDARNRQRVMVVRKLYGF